MCYQKSLIRESHMKIHSTYHIQFDQILGQYKLYWAGSVVIQDMDINHHQMSINFPETGILRDYRLHHQLIYYYCTTSEKCLFCQMHL